MMNFMVPQQSRLRCAVARSTSRGMMATVLSLVALVACIDAQQGLGGGGGGGPFSMDNPAKKAQDEPKKRRVPYYAPPAAKPLVEVAIVGNQAVSEPRIRSMLETRVGRDYDPDLVQRDVRSLIASGLFRDVRTLHSDSSDGIHVTFELSERPLIGYVRFIGNQHKSSKALQKQLTIHPGDPLNRFQVEENRRKLEDFYRDKGYSEAAVTTLEGGGGDDKGVEYQIAEGNRQRIWSTTFEGNTIAKDARLRTQILSKPGVLWVFGGKVDQEEIEQDIQRITLYYRNLGYFRARVTHSANYDQQRKWLSVKYVIEEGQRYRVRNVICQGNAIFNTNRVVSGTTMRPGDFVNLKQLDADTKSIRELYGNSGYIFADVTPEPKYLEEPGLLDIVYTIAEGEQYRVGRIFVNIQGADAHTQRTVVLDRLTFRPGDIISMKEIRDSELRLAGSNLFRYDPQTGAKPQIVVRPPDKNPDQLASEPQTVASPTFRGQGGDDRRFPPSAFRSSTPPNQSEQLRENGTPRLAQRPVIDLMVVYPPMPPDAKRGTRK